MIEEKIAYHADKGEIVPTRDMLKTIPQIEGIQKSADLNTAVLDHVAAHIHAGMSTAEIDKLVYDYTTEHGGIPAPLNYQVLVSACADAGIAAFTGDGVNAKVMEAATEAIRENDGCGIPTVKPWNLDTVREKMELVKKSGAFAVA